MKRVVLALAAVVCAHAQGELAGDWQGTLQAGGVSLRLVVHFVKVEGGLGGTLDSLDQGAFGMKLASVRQEAGTLRFTLERPEAEFEGEWSAQSGEFRGNWRQGGNALPLALKRAEARAAAQALGADDREFLLGWLRRTGDAYAAALAGVTEAQWRFKPSAAGWSIAECAEHLIIAQRDLFRTTTQRIARIPIPNGQKRLGRTDDQRVIGRMTDRSQKATAAESETPMGVYATPADAAREFTAARAAMVQWVASTEADLRGHGVRDPQGGFTDAYQFLLTIAAHTARHLAQIGEVKADPHYPR